MECTAWLHCDRKECFLFQTLLTRKQCFYFSLLLALYGVCFFAFNNLFFYLMREGTSKWRFRFSLVSCDVFYLLSHCFVKVINWQINWLTDWLIVTSTPCKYCSRWRVRLSVPMRDESQWMRLQFADGELEDGVPRGRPVAVIVLQDGTELHFFQFVDSDHSLDIDDSRYERLQST